LFAKEFEKRCGPFDGTACDDKSAFAELAG
jgi:hypothetical protein